jgi:glycosyltransferase involved in cell wall biosynthesis
MPALVRRERALWTAGTADYAQERADVKGQDLAMQLFPCLARRKIEFDMSIVSPHRGKIRSRDEMAAWYSSSKVVVITSMIEGLPNAGLEGSACGCAVVSTPVGVMPRLVQDGVNGYIVRDRTPEAFAEAIELAVRNWEGMRQSIDERILPFSWDSLAGVWWDYLIGRCE